MMHLKRTPEFKSKFPEIAAADDDQRKDEEDQQSSFSIRFKPPSSS